MTTEKLKQFCKWADCVRYQSEEGFRPKCDTDCILSARYLMLWIEKHRGWSDKEKVIVVLREADDTQ